MRVRKIQATLYGRNTCESVWHMVKDCRICKALYYCDKRVIRGYINYPPVPNDDPLDPANPLNMGLHPANPHYGVRWHEYNPFHGGRLPQVICSKSGKTIIECGYLSDCAILQYKTR